MSGLSLTLQFGTFANNFGTFVNTFVNKLFGRIGGSESPCTAIQCLYRIYFWQGNEFQMNWDGRWPDLHESFADSRKLLEASQTQSEPLFCESPVGALNMFNFGVLFFILCVQKCSSILGQDASICDPKKCVFPR